jgi:hypothetical protein
MAAKLGVKYNTPGGTQMTYIGRALCSELLYKRSLTIRKAALRLDYPDASNRCSMLRLYTRIRGDLNKQDLDTIARSK